MKRNKIFVLGLIAAFVAILSLTLVSGTWAKYTSTVTGTSKARVAKWAFSFDGTETKADLTKNVTFNLFDSVDDENVKKAGEGETTIIAPGTSGKLAFNITNLGEVTAKATVTFTLTNDGNIPVEFYKNGVKINPTAGVYNLGEITLDYAGKAGGSNTKDLGVTWKWAFDGNDATDTTLGIGGTAEIIVNAQVVFEQVD